MVEDFAVGFFAAFSGVCARACGTANRSSATAATPEGMWKQAVFLATALALPAQDGRGVRILAERFRIAAAQYFHHPVIEIVHRMRLDGLEAAIVFFVGLFNVIPQSETQVLVLAPEPYVFRTQHPDVLHRNLGHAEGAPMQFLLFWWQRVEVKNRRRFPRLAPGLRLNRRTRLGGKIQFKIRRRLVQSYRHRIGQKYRFQSWGRLDNR